MLTTLVATLMLVPQFAAPVCAVSGAALPPEAPTVDALGARFRFCCTDCAGKFKADPKAAIDAASKAERVAGTSLYDPVSGKRLSANLVRGGYAVHHAIRYAFENPRNRNAFQTEPAKYTERMVEVMYCPVMDVPLVNLYGTSGFVDVDGMRVYLCCDMCLGKMRRSPSTYAAGAKVHLGPAKAFDVPAALSKLTWPPQ